MSNKQIQQRSDFRAQTLNKEFAKMVDSIKSILECSQISVDKKHEEALMEKNMIEGLQLQLSVAQLVNSTEVLLGLLSELKEAYILGDYERHNKNIKAQKELLNHKILEAESTLKRLNGGGDADLSDQMIVTPGLTPNDSQQDSQ
jgi:hypothetical protein